MEEIQIIRLIALYKELGRHLKNDAVGLQSGHTRPGEPRIKAGFSYIVKYEAAALLPFILKFLLHHRFSVYGRSPDILIRRFVSSDSSECARNGTRSHRGIHFHLQNNK